jgi:Domain of unknown function (DUF4291)
MTNQEEESNVRAAYTDSTIIVYHRCNDEIANAVIQSQTLNTSIVGDSFLHFWITPSFRLAFSQYRSPWAQQANRQRVLALHITRAGWEQALEWHESRTSGTTPYVRLTSAEELAIEGESDVTYRTFNLSLSPRAVDNGLSQWIVKIGEVTDLMKEIGDLVDAGKVGNALALLPSERRYKFCDGEVR